MATDAITTAVFVIFRLNRSFYPPTSVHLVSVVLIVNHRLTVTQRYDSGPEVNQGKKQEKEGLRQTS